MSLNPLKFPKNHFKTNFFFLQFLVGGPTSAMIVVIWEAQTSIEKKMSVKWSKIGINRYF